VDTAASAPLHVHVNVKVSSSYSARARFSIQQEGNPPNSHDPMQRLRLEFLTEGHLYWLHGTVLACQLPSEPKGALKRSLDLRL
jgi:hypothetical protein